MEYFVGDLTQGLKGEPVGDALVSGAGQLMSQTANEGGNVPLSVPQAVAYKKATKEVQLAYAEEDRATKSPFDTSTPNTMLGSIVYRLAPYFATSRSSLGSISGTVSGISKMVFGSFSTLLQPVTAQAADGSEFKMCNDPMLLDNDVAAGPYCNIIYGIPTDYLDMDPIEVVNKLVASGDVNEDSGEPVDGKDLAKWMSLCTDGGSNQAANCRVTDEQRALYAVYTIDHRVQKTMDEDLPTPRGSEGDLTTLPGTPVSNPIDGAATICVDAGHPPNGAPGEPEYALKTAKALQTELANRGYKVIMTRTDSGDVSISARPKKCIDGKANLMYSIHGENDGVAKNHPFTIYMKSDRSQSAKSKSYAKIIQDAMTSALAGSHGMQGKQGICMEGSCTALSSLGIFSGADAGGLPAVLSEVVRSNNNGTSAIDDPDYLKRLVTGIANGIQQIFPLPEPKPRLVYA